MGLGLSLGLSLRSRRGSGAALVTLPAGGVLDLDASKGTTLATGVSSWVDQISGIAYTQATGAQQPTPVASASLNNAAALRFAQASSQRLTGAAGAAALFPSAATLLVVAAVSTDTFYSVYETSGATEANGVWRFTDGAGYLGVFRSPRVETYPAAGQTYSVPSTGAHCFVIRSDATRYRWTLDGVHAPQQAGAYSAGTTHTIGYIAGAADRYFNGDLARVYAWPSYLSDADVAQAVAFCRQTYGTP